MNYNYPQTDLSRGVLGGLFAGIIAAVTNLVFVYRAVAEFHEFNGVDVTVVVFGSLIQGIVCGVIFYWFVHYMRRGISIYRIAVLLVTVGIIYFGLMLRRSVEGDVPADFRVIVIGTQLIMGGLAGFLIPYLFRHDSLIS